MCAARSTNPLDCHAMLAMTRVLVVGKNELFFYNRYSGSFVIARNEMTKQSSKNNACAIRRTSIIYALLSML